MYKLALYGLSGSGKSTVAEALAATLRDRGLVVQVEKLAAPLYSMQAYMYATAGRQIGAWEHDNELLRLLAAQFRRINPGFIVEDFLQRVHASSADVVINDDLRDSEVDYPRLAAEGFAFLRVVCADEVRAARLCERGDRTVVVDSDATWGYERIEPHWSIDTTTLAPGDIRRALDAIVTSWLAPAPG